MALWITNILFAVLAILFTVFAPNGWSATVIYGTAGCFLLQNVLYYVLEGRKNVLRFEFFFAIAFFFVNFAYPLFYFQHDRFFLFFCIPWEHSVISRATAITYLGYAFYMVGLSVFRPSAHRENQSSAVIMPYKQYVLLVLVMVLMFAMYIITGGWQAMKSVYSGGGSLKEVGLYSYFNVLFTLSAYLVCIFLFRMPRTKWWVYLLVVLFTMLITLSTGSRTVPLSLALILLVGWHNHVRRFRLWEILVVTVVGVAVLFFVVSVRECNGNWLVAAQHIQLRHITDVFSDLIVNGRNLYVLVDYGLTHSCTFFHGMLIDLATPIPGVSKLIVRLTGDPYETLCAQEFTSYMTLGPGASWGLGCNMIGDAFRSFGYIGVALSMFLVGWAVRRIYEASETNIYLYAIYYLVVSYSVFYTRAPILFPPRMVVWSLLLLWITHLVCTHPRITLWLQDKGKEDVSCA